MLGVSKSEGDIGGPPPGYQPDGHGPAAFFDANTSQQWLGEIGHVFDDPVEADSGFLPPAQSTAGDLEGDSSPQWYRTLSESPYRMGAHPLSQEEVVVGTGTTAGWKHKKGGPSPERRRKGRRSPVKGAQGGAAAEYTPSSTPEDMLQRAREHVYGIQTLADMKASPFQTTLQRKPWRNNMSKQISPIRNGRRAGESTAAAAAVAVPWQMSVAEKVVVAGEVRLSPVKVSSPSKGRVKPLQAGPKGQAKPTPRPTRSSNVMVASMLKGASKTANPINFRVTCIKNLTDLMGGKGFVLEDPRRPRDAAKAAQMTFSSGATQPHAVEGVLLALMEDEEEKGISDAARTAYIKFHEVWATQEDAILRRGEELKKLKAEMQAKKRQEDGAQMKSMSWLTNYK